MPTETLNAPPPTQEGPPVSSGSRTTGPVFDALDAIEGHDSPEAPPSKEAPAAKTPEAKVPDTKPAVESKKASLGEDLDPIVAKVKPAEVEGEPKTPKQLRDAYAKLKDEYAARELTLKQYESEKAKLKEEMSAEARKTIDAELKSLRETADDRDRRLQLADYKQSDDYLKKYEEPAKEAWQDAMQSLDGAKITLEDGTTRDVTVDDLAALIRMPAAQAHTTAHEKYGLIASLLLEHRKNILGIEHGRQKALAEFKTKASTFREQQASERLRAVDNFRSSIRKFSDDFPELFGPEKGDDEGNSLLDKGDVLVQTAMVGDNLPNDISPEQRADTIQKAQQMVAVRARAFGRLYHRHQKLSAENAELKEKLAKLEVSDPDPGGGDPDVKASKPKSLEEALDEIPGFNRY